MKDIFTSLFLEQDRHGSVPQKPWHDETKGHKLMSRMVSVM